MAELHHGAGVDHERAGLLFCGAVAEAVAEAVLGASGLLARGEGVLVRPGDDATWTVWRVTDRVQVTMARGAAAL